MASHRSTVITSCAVTIALATSIGLLMRNIHDTRSRVVRMKELQRVGQEIVREEGESSLDRFVDEPLWALIVDDEGTVTSSSSNVKIRSLRDLRAVHRTDDGLLHLIKRRAQSGGFVRFLWSSDGQALEEYYAYVKSLDSREGMLLVARS